MISKRIGLSVTVLIVSLYLCYYYWNLMEEWKMEQLEAERLALVKAKFNEKLVRHMTDDMFVPPFVSFVSPYAIAPVHNLSICCISKSMSTMMRGMACALYDTEEFISNNRSILESYGGRFCQGKNEFSRMNGVELEMRTENFTKIAVVRDPVDRFISFFSDKCVYGEGWRPADRCYNCQNNATCFLEKQYHRFLEFSHKKNSTLKPSLEDYHTAPFSWNCEFGKYLKEYKIVKMHSKYREKGVKELMGILKASRVPESTIKYLEASAIRGDTVHVTYDSEAHTKLRKEIEGSRKMRDLLRKMYYLDYLIFGFDTSFIDS